MLIPGALSVAIALAVATLSSTPDSLEPEASIFGHDGVIRDYYYKIARVLLPTPDRHVQMVRDPDRALPEAVYIELTGTEDQVSCRVISNRFRTGMSIPLVVRPGAIDEEQAREQTVVPISITVCEQLEAVWVLALKRMTPYPPGVVRMRGDSYHFATLDRSYGYRSGMCFRPEKGSKMGALARLGMKLLEFARSSVEERARLTGMLAADAAQLLLRFKQE